MVGQGLIHVKSMVSFWLLGEGQAFFVGSVAACKLPVFNKPN